MLYLLVLLTLILYRFFEEQLGVHYVLFLSSIS